MPFFGLLLIILALWIILNTFNGNLIDVVLGKAQFNFSGTNKTTPVAPAFQSGSPSNSKT